MNNVHDLQNKMSMLYMEIFVNDGVFMNVRKWFFLFSERKLGQL